MFHSPGRPAQCPSTLQPLRPLAETVSAPSSRMSLESLSPTAPAYTNSRRAVRPEPWFATSFFFFLIEIIIYILLPSFPPSKLLHIALVALFQTHGLCFSLTIVTYIQVCMFLNTHITCPVCSMLLMFSGLSVWYW